MRNNSTSLQYARWSGVRPDDSQTHFFERCSDQQVSAFEKLLDESGCSGVKVTLAYHVDNSEMRFRYDELKGRMQAGADQIPKETNRLLQIMESNKDMFDQFVGQYDSTVNEFPLWHGTPSTEAVAGISGNGMDINFVVRAAYGLGFYFSDEASISWAFAGNPHRVSAEHPSMKCIFLSRVVVGKVRKQPGGVSDEKLRNELYDECRGVGGKFTPDSPFHTVRASTGNYFVCMDSHQIYPEYILFCSGH